MILPEALPGADAQADFWYGSSAMMNSPPEGGGGWEVGLGGAVTMEGTDRGRDG